MKSFTDKQYQCTFGCGATYGSVHGRRRHNKKCKKNVNRPAEQLKHANNRKLKQQEQTP